MLTKEQYEARCVENSKVSGYGIEGMTIHVPCPFCAAPDWLSYTLPTMHEVLGEGATCKECGRGARVLFDNRTPNVSRFGFVQTSGDDPPPYLSWIQRQEVLPFPTEPPPHTD